jgi:PKD repeat protein
MLARAIVVAAILSSFSFIASATTITNTRPEIAQMAGYWEVDSVQISPLANAQSTCNGSWEYMQPSTGSTAADGDEHINMALDSSGTGSTCQNLGTESEIVAEIINAAVSLLPTGNTHAKSRGVFRYYHEHAGEIKYEIHPMTERHTWNGSAFVLANDYHNTIRPVADATTKALSTYTDLVQGNNQTVTATVLADNNRVVITYPTGAGADTVNYVQYDGQVVQTLTNDLVSSYITFHATNCPKGAISGARVMRCRLITNTVGYTVATGLLSNQTITVNVLNRVDMLGMSNIVASLSASQTTNFVQPLEWITCGITNIGAVSAPVANFSGTPTNGAPLLMVTFTDTSTGSITNRAWSFGDGGTSNTTATTVQYTYAGTGTNTVRLIVTGLGGSNTNTKPNYIVANSAATAPLANFTAAPTNGTEPLMVTFTDTSTGTTPLSLSWDLGDSTTTNTASGAAFMHSYAAGTYTVTLTASNSAGTSTLVSNNLIAVITPFQAWQLQYFNCTNCPQAAPDADPFGKGMSNTNQFLAGLNPTNPASVFLITSVVADSNNNVFITWATAGVRTNAVQASSGDADGNYTNSFTDTSGSIVIPSMGDATTNYLDVGGATNIPTRYYRIRLVP